MHSLTPSRKEFPVRHIAKLILILWFPCLVLFVATDSHPEAEPAPRSVKSFVREKFYALFPQRFPYDELYGLGGTVLCPLALFGVILYLLKKNDDLDDEIFDSEEDTTAARAILEKLAEQNGDIEMLLRGAVSKSGTLYQEFALLVERAAATRERVRTAHETQPDKATGIHQELDVIFAGLTADGPKVKGLKTINDDILTKVGDVEQLRMKLTTELNDMGGKKDPSTRVEELKTGTTAIAAKIAAIEQRAPGLPELKTAFEELFSRLKVLEDAEVGDRIHAMERIVSKTQKTLGEIERELPGERLDKLTGFRNELTAKLEALSRKLQK